MSTAAANPPPRRKRAPRKTAKATLADMPVPEFPPGMDAGSVLECTGPDDPRHDETTHLYMEGASHCQPLPTGGPVDPAEEDGSDVETITNDDVGELLFGHSHRLTSARGPKNSEQPPTEKKTREKDKTGGWPQPLARSYFRSTAPGDGTGMFRRISDGNGDTCLVRLCDASVHIVRGYYLDDAEPYPEVNAVLSDQAGMLDERVLDCFDLEILPWGAPEPILVSGVSERALDAADYFRRPGTGLFKTGFEGTRDGKVRLAQCIRATSGDFPEHPAYDRIGWFVRGDDVFYVHAGGAFDADGARSDVVFRGDDVTDWFRLPDPPASIADGRTAVLAVLRFFDLTPDRVAAATLGAAFRAAMGKPRASITFMARNRSGKSGVMAFSVQLFCPNVRWNKFPTPGGERENLSPAQLERLTHAVGDALLPFDDLSSDDSADAQRRQFSHTVRQLFNGSYRGRMNRDRTQGDVRRPRCIGMLTAEGVSAAESAENRTHVVDLRPGEVDITGLVLADTEGGPVERATAMAGFVCWWAQFMPAKERVSDLRTKAAAALRAGLPEGFDARYITEMSDGFLAGGWAFCDFAEDQGYLTAEEATTWRARFTTGLVESTRLQAERAEGRSEAQRAVDYLWQGLRTGRVHATTRTGEAPPSPHAFGWREDRASGDHVGYTDDGVTVWVLPDAATRFITRYAHELSEPLNKTSRGLADQLATEGLITSKEETNGTRTQRRNGVSIKVDGAAVKVWDLTRPADPDTEPAPPPDTAPVADIGADWAGTSTQQDVTEPATEPITPPEPPAAMAPAARPTARSRPRKTPPVPGARPTRVRAVVATRAGLVRADGTTTPLPRPATLPAILDAAASTVHTTQVIITPALHKLLKLPAGLPPSWAPDGPDGRPRKPTLPAGYQALAEAGWCGYSADGAIPPLGWARLHHGDRHADLIIASWWEGSEIIDAASEPVTWAVRLEDVARRAGEPFGPGAGGTATRLIRRHLEQAKTRRPRWVVGDEWPIEVRHAAGRRVCDWSREPTTAEAGGYVHRYDGVKAYLTHYRTPLAVDDLTHTGAVAFDAKQAGMWLVTCTAWPHPLIPAPWSCYADLDPVADPTWLPTAVIALAIDRGVTVEVLDSWTAPAVEQAGLGAFVSELRDALKATETGTGDPFGAHTAAGIDPVVRSALKSLYHAGYGAMMSAGRTIHRPDWYAGIQASAWCTLLRKIYDTFDRTQRAPLAVHVDAVRYHSTIADPVAACPPLNGPKRATLGTELGQFTVELDQEGSDHAA